MTQGLIYTRKTTSTEATKQLAQTLAPYLQPGDAIILNGDLGSGKTQFVQGVAAGLGMQSAVTSPTFNILMSYEEGSLPLYHFDWYRLEQENELEDVSYYDVIDGPGATFIEWAEKFPSALPYDYLQVEISVEESEIRTIKVSSYGERARRLLVVWAKDSKSRLTRMN